MKKKKKKIIKSVNCHNCLCVCRIIELQFWFRVVLFFFFFIFQKTKLNWIEFHSLAVTDWLFHFHSIMNLFKMNVMDTFFDDSFFDQEKKVSYDPHGIKKKTLASYFVTDFSFSKIHSKQKSISRIMSISIVC